MFLSPRLQQLSLCFVVCSMDLSSSGKRWFVSKNAPTKQCSSSHTNCTYSQCYATYNLLAGTGKLHWFVLCFRICEAWTDISRGRTLPGQLGQGTLKAAEGSGWCHISILQLVNVLFVVGWDVYWEDNTNCSLEFPQSSKCNCEAQRLCPDILLIVVSTAALQHSGLVSSSVIGRMTCWNTTRMFCQRIFWRMWRQCLCLSLSSWWWKWEVVLATVCLCSSQEAVKELEQPSTGQDCSNTRFACFLVDLCPR